MDLTIPGLLFFNINLEMAPDSSKAPHHPQHKVKAPYIGWFSMTCYLIVSTNSEPLTVCAHEHVNVCTHTMLVLTFVHDALSVWSLLSFFSTLLHCTSLLGYLLAIPALLKVSFGAISFRKFSLILSDWVKYSIYYCCISFPPALLKYNWLIKFYTLKVYNVMIWYTLWNDYYIKLINTFISSDNYLFECVWWEHPVFTVLATLSLLHSIVNHRHHAVHY